MSPNLIGQRLPLRFGHATPASPATPPPPKPAEILRNLPNDAFHQTALRRSKATHFFWTPSSAKPLSLRLKKVLRKVLSKVVVYNSSDEHVNTLMGIRQAVRYQLLRERQNVVLLNVDTHSDLYNYDGEHVSGGPTSAAWMNPAILENPKISEVIWVRPPEMDSAVKGYHFVLNKPTKDLGPDKTIYVDHQAQILYFSPPADLLTHPAKYKPVTVRTITADQLPDLQGRDVIMSLDMDYFSNTGYDTHQKIQVPYRGQEQVCDLFETLARKHIRPFLLSVALSPKYSCHYSEQGWDPSNDPTYLDLNRIGSALRDYACHGSPSK